MSEAIDADHAAPVAGDVWLEIHQRLEQVRSAIDHGSAMTPQRNQDVLRKGARPGQRTSQGRGSAGVAGGA